MLTNVNHILGPLNMYSPCCGKQNFIQCATIRSEWTPDHQLHKCPPVVAINGNEHRKTWWKHDGNIMEHLTDLTENDGGNTMETTSSEVKKSADQIPAIAPSAPRQGWPPRDVATWVGSSGRFHREFWVKMPENPMEKWKTPWKLRENLIWIDESTLKMLKTSLSSPCKRRCFMLFLNRVVFLCLGLILFVEVAKPLQQTHRLGDLVRASMGAPQFMMTSP